MLLNVKMPTIVGILTIMIAVLRLRGLMYHMRVFLFYKSAEKVLSYARLNCAVFNYFLCHLDRLDIL